MKCDKCNQEIEPGEEREHFGEILCEDCYIEVMSPLKTCDPWAVHSAKTFEKYSGKNKILTSIQSKILKILDEKGAVEPDQLLSEMGSNLTLKDLEREFATLRHMEKVRGEKQGNKVFWRLW